MKKIIFYIALSGIAPGLIFEGAPQKGFRDIYFFDWKYRFPTEPLLIILAAAGLNNLMKRKQTKLFYRQ